MTATPDNFCGVPIPDRTEDEVRLLQSSKQFVADFVPPDYLIDGILERGFIYSLTAPTGWAKAAIALLFAASIARGVAVGAREVARGRVLYFAGENPDDLRMRWVAMADHLGFDVDTIDVHFIPGVFSIEKMEAKIRKEVDELGGVSLTVVDTSAAYFDGTNENDNSQMGPYARMLRRLTWVRGRPSVLVCSHPAKAVTSKDGLQPRGGGAFIAEMDGNLCCMKKESIVELHFTGKFRGPEFEPIAFQLVPIISEKVKDRRGRHVPTVMVRVLSEHMQAELEDKARKDEDAVLVLLNTAPGGSLTKMAEALGWLYGKDNKPNKQRVSRALEKLRRAGLANEKRGEWQLTPQGSKEAKKAS